MVGYLKKNYNIFVSFLVMTKVFLYTLYETFWLQTIIIETRPCIFVFCIYLSTKNR